MLCKNGLDFDFYALRRAIEALFQPVNSFPPPLLKSSLLYSNNKYYLLLLLQLLLQSIIIIKLFPSMDQGMSLNLDKLLYYCYV